MLWKNEQGQWIISRYLGCDIVLPIYNHTDIFLLNLEKIHIGLVVGGEIHQSGKCFLNKYEYLSSYMEIVLESGNPGAKEAETGVSLGHYGQHHLTEES